MPWPLAFRSADLRGKDASRTALWSGAIFAGVMGALAFFAWQILATKLLLGAPTWATTRLIASIPLGEEVSRIPLTFDLSIIATAMAVHFALSILYAFVMAPLVHRLERPSAVAAGIAIGAAIYLINFHGFTPAVFPWMAEMRGWITFCGHLLFGATVAYAYKLAQAAQRKSLDEPASRSS